MSALTIAVIGLGSQGKKHLQAALKLASLKVVERVVSCDPIVKAGELPIGVQAHYLSYQQLFSSEKVAIAVVVTPNNMHLKIVQLALDKGVSVLLEKPLVTSLAELESLKAVYQNNNAMVVVCQQRFFKQCWAEAKKVLPLLGVPRRFWYHFSVEDTKQSWYWDAATAGGGVWLNMGWHPLAVIEWLWGGIDSVRLTSNRGGARPWQYQTDHSSFARVTMQKGVEGSVFVSCVHQPREIFRVETSRGVLLLDNERLTIWHEGGWEEIMTNQEIDPYQLQLQQIIEVSHQGKLGKKWADQQLEKAVHIQQHIFSASEVSAKESLYATVSN